MTSILSYILGHAYKWMIKLTFVLILLVLYQLYAEPYIQPLQYLLLYISNKSFLRVLPYSAALLLDQVFVLAVSFSIFTWIVEDHVQPQPSQPQFQTRKV